MYTFHDPAIPLLGMLPTVMLGKRICTRIFIEDYIKQQNTRNNSNDPQ